MFKHKNKFITEVTCRAPFTTSMYSCPTSTHFKQRTENVSLTHFNSIVEPYSMWRYWLLRSWAMVIEILQCLWKYLFNSKFWDYWCLFGVREGWGTSAEKKKFCYKQIKSKCSQLESNYHSPEVSPTEDVASALLNLSPNSRKRAFVYSKVLINIDIVPTNIKPKIN